MRARNADVFLEHPAIGVAGRISGVVELAGATMILTNRWPRLGAWLIAIFLVPVTITVHGDLMLHAPDDTSRQIQLSFFLKGVTMTGAALPFTQLGVRPARDRDRTIRG